MKFNTTSVTDSYRKSLLRKNFHYFGDFKRMRTKKRKKRNDEFNKLAMSHRCWDGLKIQFAYYAAFSRSKTGRATEFARRRKVQIKSCLILFFDRNNLLSPLGEWEGEGEGERRIKRKEQRRREGKKMRKEKNGELYLRAPFQPAGAGFNTFQ